ncbi:MAG TPA: NUDIX domain-containing protein [Anaerolineales bacterium]|nr:NUDIX domain-containing protein [Anaerolineales bacterium]
MMYSSIIKDKPEFFSNDNVLFQILLNEEEIQSWQAGRLKRLADKNQPEEWADIGIIFNDPYVVILRDLVEFADGSRNGYVRLYNRAYLEGGAAGVVMLPEMGGKLLLMHQFRHATRSWHWEIPRGFGEPGVQAEDQARAEIEEEIGGEISRMSNLGLYFNNTGLEGNPIYLFLVNMKAIGEPKLKFGVDQFRWVSVSELEQLIKDEEVTDGFTIAAYTRAKLKGLI